MVMTFRERLEYLGEVKSRSSKNTHPNGTYVSVELEAASKKELDKWVTDNKIPNAADPDQYHTTVIYSRKGVPDVKNYDLNLPIEAHISGWKIFPTQNGKKCLVAIIDSPELEKHHKTIRSKFGATHDYPDYHPHVTVSYDYTGSAPDTTPKMKLLFSKAEIKPLDPDFVPPKKND